jgi:hypothetical protein
MEPISLYGDLEIAVPTYECFVNRYSVDRRFFFLNAFLKIRLLIHLFEVAVRLSIPN